jgi:hypothetical protein
MDTRIPNARQDPDAVDGGPAVGPARIDRMGLSRQRFSGTVF